jgi:hypothetical protein
MKRTLALGAVAVVLMAGCGGGSDSSKSDDGGSGGSDTSSGQSAGDKQYIDPFQDSSNGVGCLSKRQVQVATFRITARVKDPERRQKAIKTVKGRACR